MFRCCDNKNMASTFDNNFWKFFNSLYYRCLVVLDTKLNCCQFNRKPNHNTQTIPVGVVSGFFKKNISRKGPEYKREYAERI